MIILRDTTGVAVIISNKGGDVQEVFVAQLKKNILQW